MGHSTHYRQDIVVAVAVAVAVAACLLAAAVGEASAASSSSCVGFDLHHRSSPVVRRWAEARGHPALAAEWPAKGSPEYYSELSRHDRAHLARRGLAGAGAAADGGLVTFAAGNDTHRLAQLGFLYYVEVEIGTPNATFLVALDTGSDLFWVPCDCKQCAAIGNDTGLQPYSPRLSSTSRPVTCADALCDMPNACAGGGASTNGSCPYAVRYVSANTSSSGVLVQDVLHLTRESGELGAAAAEPLAATVVVGCGQVQTGIFLEGGAFDGLLGLGMDRVSVPSVLAATGVVAADSFSMCFSRDGVGRINFGDAGSRAQSETPFIVRSTHPTYNVSFTAINVENKSVPAGFTAVMDSGTSFTYLNDPEYTQLATNFNSQIHERRANFSTAGGDSLPFEFCYALSPNQTEVELPVVSLTAAGGALFPVTRPFIVFGDSAGNLIGYCLAILKSDIPINIIGQNFMTGLKVVFDRERSVLGWQKFDCYKNARTADDAQGAGESPSPSPAPTTLTPQHNGGNTSYPGAAPLPPRRSAGSRHAAGALGGASLLLPLLMGAALVV